MTRLDYTMLRVLAYVSLSAALTFAALFTASVAQAQTKPDVIAKWDQLNDNCRGAQILPDKNPTCKERDAISRRLVKQGWLQCRHENWVSPDHLAAFVLTVQRYNDQAAANLYAIDSIMPAMGIELRRKVPDDKLFCIWNEARPIIQARAPFGATMLVPVMQQLERIHSGSHDPRYRVDQ